VVSWIRWKPPAEGWVKITTDGACRRGSAAGWGGIL
jgi:hypothetical protein